MKIQKPFPIALALLTASAAASSAQTFQYNDSDLLIGFRVTPGSAGSSSYELVVDGGAVTTYANLPTGTTITVANVTSSLVTNSFSSVNDISWSAFADVSTNVLSAGSTNYPLHALWLTKPRISFGSQTSPWTQGSYFNQGDVVSSIEGLGDYATIYGSADLPAGPPRNTLTGIILPAGDPLFSYSAYIGPLGNFKQKFQGDVEQETGDGFTTSAQDVRSDFYQLFPGSGPALYLGYFEFSTNGVLTYTSGPSAIVIPQPTITSIVRSGTVNTIAFSPTVVGATYSLLGSSSLAAPRSSWSVIGSPASGTGSPMTLQDTSASGQVTFYEIQAH
jgi:hypothetical protein